MALNFPGPYEVRLYYSSNYSVGGIIQHSQRLNVIIDPEPDPGDLFSTISAIRRDGSPFALDGEVDDWVAAMQPFYPNAAGNSFDYAELWKYEPESFDASFVSTYPIALAGTSASVVNQTGQAIVTFRTLGGGVMKLSFMESVVGVGVRDTLPFANAALDALADSVVAGTFPWVGRDGTYPFACIALFPGNNEAVFKKRFR